MSTPSSTPVLDTKRGKQILILLLAVAFLDFVDASIVNVALPSIRADLGFTVRNLQWVLTGYLLTYGGLMLLGSRASDLFGRRRLLVAGTAQFALSSLAAGVSPDDTGLQLLHDLFVEVHNAGGNPPVVIDSEDLVTNPAGTMAAYCAAVELPFIADALNWHAGQRSEWARSSRWPWPR